MDGVKGISPSAGSRHEYCSLGSFKGSLAVKKLPYVWINHRVDTPAWVVKHIGRIAIEWSNLEWQLEETIRLLMNLPIEQGRIATTGMNMRSRVITATNLVKSHVYQSVLPSSFSDRIVALNKQITGNVESDRNKFVHGLYGKWRGKWYVLRNSGVRTFPQLQEIGKKLPRAVLPQREELSPSFMEATLSEITKLRLQMIKFCEDLEAALPPSSHESPRRIRQHSFPGAHRK